VNDNPNRIACEKCGAANFPSSANCWQCGEPLRKESTPAEQPAPETPAAPVPVEPTPGIPPPPQPPSSPIYVPPRNRQDTETLVVLGFVFGGLGLIGFCCGCCSWVLSITAIVLGAIAYSKGDNRGLWVIILGAVALIASVIVQVLALPFQQFKGPWPGGFPSHWPRP